MKQDFNDGANKIKHGFVRFPPLGGAGRGLYKRKCPASYPHHVIARNEAISSLVNQISCILIEENTLHKTTFGHHTHVLPRSVAAEALSLWLDPK
jgi:hypothetical protein